MKVLYVTGMNSTKYGGLEKYNIELAKKGIELSLIYNSIPQSKEYLKDIKKNNITFHTIDGSLLKRTIQTIRIIRHEKPSIIHYHFGKLIYFLVPLCFILFPKIKQIYTVHCELPRYSTIEYLLMNICAYCLDLIVCVSEGVKSQFIEKFNYTQKTIVSYLGVEKKQLIEDNLKVKLNINNDDAVLTSIGFDIYVKGYDILAKAIKKLKNINGIPPFKVLIIGLSKNEEERFDEILKRLEITDSVISVGIVNNIDDYLDITDIYLQPSRNEAISLSIMEAMLYALPIIATNTGGIPEVCINDENGFLFEKGDDYILTLLMHKLITNAELRRSMGIKSYEFSSKFSLEKSIDSIINIYTILGN